MERVLSRQTQLGFSRPRQRESPRFGSRGDGDLWQGLTPMLVSLTADTKLV